MIENEMASSSLNEQQVMMLRLLKNPLPKEDFIQMQRLAIKLLAKQLDQEVEKWELDKDINEGTYETLSRLHFRSSSKGKE